MNGFRWGWVALACLSAGCSSSSSSGAPTESTGEPEGGSAMESGVPADAGCTKTADLASYDGGSQWACITAACATSVQACAADCACNSAVLQALLCSADGGSAIQCFGAALVDDKATALLTCSQTANATCADGGDASGD